MHTTPGASEVSRGDLGMSDVPESGGTRYIIVGGGRSAEPSGRAWPRPGMRWSSSLGARTTP